MTVWFKYLGLPERFVHVIVTYDLYIIKTRLANTRNVGDEWLLMEVGGFL